MKLEAVKPVLLDKPEALNQESTSIQDQMQKDAAVITKLLLGFKKSAENDRLDFVGDRAVHTARNLIDFELLYGKKFEPILSSVKSDAADTLVQIQEGKIQLEGSRARFSLIPALAILSDRKLNAKDRGVLAPIAESNQKDFDAVVGNHPVAGATLSESEKMNNAVFLVQYFDKMYLDTSVLAVRAALGSVPPSFKNLLDEYQSLLKRSEFSEKDASRIVVLQQSIMKETLKAVSPVR